MLRCLQSPENYSGNSAADTTVHERQREMSKRLHQEEANYINERNPIELDLMPNQFHTLIHNDQLMFLDLSKSNWPLKVDQCFKSNSPNYDNSHKMDYHSFSSISGPSSVSGMAASKSNMASKLKLKKRKSEETQFDDEEEDYKGNRIEGDATVKESEISSEDISKEYSKVQKPDYIHVRARRGQATDTHSLAERARREKISKKMKCLQDLVPGCDKVTGKAGMLDEIINYVQSLQRQVEFLSMKLAVSNPRLDFNIDNLFAKDFPAYVPTAAAILEMADSAAYLQYIAASQQGATRSGIEMPIINPIQMAPQTTASDSMSTPQVYLDSSGFPQVSPLSTLGTDLQSLYNVSFH